MEPAHPGTVRYYEDLAIYRVIREKFQTAIDNAFDSVARKIGFAVTATIPVVVEIGGKGKFLEADPDHNLLFLGPEMTEFFKHFKEKMLQEHISEDDIKNIYRGLRGIVFLDTLGDKTNATNEVTSLDTGLPVLEIKEVA
jgi:hypothetical protein